MTEKLPDLKKAALQMIEAGFSVIPTGADKKASTLWKPYQKNRMTPTEVNQHFIGAERLAIICGLVSGNLECLDFDDPEVYQPFLELLEARQQGIAARLLKRQTPSGGYHLIYRCSAPIAGNLKLACTKESEVRIETRGEGGYFLSAPSPGYTVIEGSIFHCPTLSPEDVETIHSTAKAFDQREQQAPPDQKKHYKKTESGDDRPGDRFNRDNEWPALLDAEGWIYTRTIGDRQHWTRPGKQGGSISATVDPIQGLYVFSSNTPLPTEKPLDKFAFYTFYHFGGDFSAAARSLAGDQGPADRHRKEYSSFVIASRQQTPAADPEEWEPTIKEWPVMDRKAYRGLAGDFVALASEKSEADPAAILITFLVRFGVEVGPGPVLFVGDSRHYSRINSVIAGNSSKARKGTSGKPVDRLFSKIERHARYSPGPFSSGEGIIHAVRDPVKKWDEKKQYDVVTDPGVEDKRFFILDEEFGGAMSQTRREGNPMPSFKLLTKDNMER